MVTAMASFLVSDDLRLLELLHLVPVIKCRFPILSSKCWRGFLGALKDIKIVLD